MGTPEEARPKLRHFVPLAATLLRMISDEMLECSSTQRSDLFLSSWIPMNKEGFYHKSHTDNKCVHLAIVGC